MYVLHFGQTYLSKPTSVEKDASVTHMFSHEARLRNLTYSAPIYVDIDFVEYNKHLEEGQDPENREVRNRTSVSR